MSAILIHATPSIVHLASDAGAWNADGTLAGIQSKIVNLSDAIGVMVGRGSVAIVDRIAATAISGSFDYVVRNLPRALRHAVRDLGASGELFVAGVSERTGEHQAWFVTSGGRRGARPYTLNPIKYLVSPLPSDDFSFKGFEPADIGDAFDGMRARKVRPIWDGPQHMSVVAGFCEMVTISKNGIVRSRVREWPEDLPVSKAGEQHLVEVQEMLFTHLDPVDLSDRVIIIDNDINNVNLRTLHDNIYPELTEDDLTASPPTTVTFVLSANVNVGSTSTAVPACDVGDWITGADLFLEVLGRIEGAGGKGGNAYINSGEFGDLGQDGFPGGVAFYTRFPIDLDVDAGEIWGGGGGGGGCISGDSSADDEAAGGGGGAGQIPGNGGTASGSEDSNEPGEPGTTEAGGAGVTIKFGRTSGDGGAPGEAGENADSNAAHREGEGGDPGAAIDGVSFVTITEGPGDRRGPEMN